MIVTSLMVERLWRSLKYECVYIRAFQNGQQAGAGIVRWIDYYNTEHPHSTHRILTPCEAHANQNESGMRLAA